MMQQAPSRIPFQTASFDDGRGRYPDRISTKAPIGMRDRIRRAAEGAGLSSAEFVRGAIEARLRQVGSATASTQEA